MRGNDTRLKQPSQPRALKHTERTWLNDPYALMPPRGARARLAYHALAAVGTVARCSMRA